MRTRTAESTVRHPALALPLLGDWSEVVDVDIDSVTRAEYRIVAPVCDGTVIIVDIYFAIGMRHTHMRMVCKVGQASRTRNSIREPHPIRPRIRTRHTNSLFHDHTRTRCLRL